MGSRPQSRQPDHLTNGQPYHDARTGNRSGLLPRVRLRNAKRYAQPPEADTAERKGTRPYCLTQSVTPKPPEGAKGRKDGEAALIPPARPFHQCCSIFSAGSGSVGSSLLTYGRPI
jgi:hypothetical protein